MKIGIIVPGPVMDARRVQRASRSLWGAQLDAGVEIYEHQPTMYDCKVLIVDKVWVSVASTNFDDRSFRLNDEANLNMYDATFAGEQVKVFEQDKGTSSLVTRAEFKNRSAVGRLFDSLAGILEAVPYLGPLLSAVPALLLAFGEGGMTPLWVVLAYLGIQALENNVMVPFVMARGMKLHPLAVIFSILLCVAAPLVAIVSILHDELY